MPKDRELGNYATHTDGNQMTDWSISMAKSTNRMTSAIASVAALWLATGAWAFYWELDVKEPVTYAEEIFGGANPGNLDLALAGDDTNTTNGRQGTRVELQLVLPDQTNIENGAQAEVTFTISGAVFGQGINWTDIDTGSDLTKVAGSIGNGRAGDSSVAVKIGTAGVTGTTGAENNATVTLYLGSLEGAAGLASGDASVTASASVRVTAGGSSNFPDKVETPTASSNVIADSEKAWTVAPQGRLVLRGWINLDDRTKLVPVFASDSSTLAWIRLLGSSGPKEADGKTFFHSGAGSRANIYVNVSGMIRDTDSVFVDLDRDGKISAGEGLDITNGVASKGFRPRQFTTGGSRPVYYTPSGETDLKHGTFNTNISIEYEDDSLVDPEAVSFVSQLAYFQVRTTHALPNAAFNDVVRVRITCEAAGDRESAGVHIPGDMCTVFLDCNGQDGMEYFGELGSISAGARTVLQAEDIAEVLGIDAWAGSLSCDVLSYYHKVSVQVLVRSDQQLHRLF